MGSNQHCNRSEQQKETQGKITGIGRQQRAIAQYSKIGDALPDRQCIQQLTGTYIPGKFNPPVSSSIRSRMVAVDLL